MLAVPEATRAENSQQTRAAALPEDKRPALSPEQMQRRAQSRGLWTSGDVEPTAATTQPRAGALPRAVVGTPSPASPANTNFRSPTIGSSDSEPAAAPPLAAAQTQPQADLSDARTGSLRPDIAAKGPSHQTADALDGDTLEIPSDQLRGKRQSEAARPAPAPKGAQGSPPNTSVWLALILIAAVVAVWFIGAAIGFWSLPWGKSTSGRNLNKAIPAKSMPEMHAAAPQTPVAPAPSAPADTAAPTVDPQPQPSAAAAPTPEPQAVQPAAAVMEADEAAPLRAPTLSGTNLDDLLDTPSSQVAPTLTAARAELKAGHPKEAEALLRPLFEKYPDDNHVAEALTQTLLARGAAVEAVGIAQQIVKKHPKRASYRVLLGDALRRAGDEPSAKLAYKEALALDPKLREAQKRLKNRKLVGTP